MRIVGESPWKKSSSCTAILSCTSNASLFNFERYKKRNFTFFSLLLLLCVLETLKCRVEEMKVTRESVWIESARPLVSKRKRRPACRGPLLLLTCVSAIGPSLCRRVCLVCVCVAARIQFRFGEERNDIDGPPFSIRPTAWVFPRLYPFFFPSLLGCCRCCCCCRRKIRRSVSIVPKITPTTHPTEKLTAGVLFGCVCRSEGGGVANGMRVFSFSLFCCCCESLPQLIE